MAKKAIVFPGIGYHKDKPLLYYSRDLAWEAGYQEICVDFSSIRWEKDDLKKPDKIKEIFAQAMEKVLSEVEINGDDEFLFISKSIGTVVAAWFAKEKGIRAKQIYFSPLVLLEEYAQESGIAFYGDSDPLADAKEIERICAEKKIKAYKTAGGNHSLEINDTEENLKNLAEIMQRVKSYIQNGDDIV